MVAADPSFGSMCMAPLWSSARDAVKQQTSSESRDWIFDLRRVVYIVIREVVEFLAAIRRRSRGLGGGCGTGCRPHIACFGRGFRIHHPAFEHVARHGVKRRPRV